jgi:hypothetical protein
MGLEPGLLILGIKQEVGLESGILVFEQEVWLKTRLLVLGHVLILEFEVVLESGLVVLVLQPKVVLGLGLPLLVLEQQVGWDLSRGCLC